VAELRILAACADLMTDKDAVGSGSQTLGQGNEVKPSLQSSPSTPSGAQVARAWAMAAAGVGAPQPQGMPICAQGVPDMVAEAGTQSQSMPIGAQGVPDTAAGAPAQRMPIRAQGVPDASAGAKIQVLVIWSRVQEALDAAEGALDAAAGAGAQSQGSPIVAQGVSYLAAGAGVPLQGASIGAQWMSDGQLQVLHTPGIDGVVEGPHRQTRSTHAADRCREWRRRQQSTEEERMPSRRMRAARSTQHAAGKERVPSRRMQAARGTHTASIR
jgi:hypothetical protein